jgi:hypothetical protein
MSTIRSPLAGLACLLVLAAPAAANEALCDSVDALIVSGQQDVSWEDLFMPRNGKLRNDNIYPAKPLLGLFSKCTVQDKVDDAGRTSSVLTCGMNESDVGPITQESRAAFGQNEFARFHDISSCLAAREHWSSYGHVGNGNFRAFLKAEGKTRPEDAIGADMSVMQYGEPPLYNAHLQFTLTTEPREAQ